MYTRYSFTLIFFFVQIQRRKIIILFFTRTIRSLISRKNGTPFHINHLWPLISSSTPSLLYYINIPWLRTTQTNTNIIVFSAKLVTQDCPRHVHEFESAISHWGGKLVGMNQLSELAIPFFDGVMSD